MDRLEKNLQLFRDYLDRDLLYVKINFILTNENYAEKISNARTTTVEDILILDQLYNNVSNANILKVLLLLQARGSALQYILLDYLSRAGIKSGDHPLEGVTD